MHYRVAVSGQYVNDWKIEWLYRTRARNKLTVCTIALIHSLWRRLRLTHLNPCVGWLADTTLSLISFQWDIFEVLFSRSLPTASDVFKLLFFFVLLKNIILLHSLLQWCIQNYIHHVTIRTKRTKKHRACQSYGVR